MKAAALVLSAAFVLAVATPAHAQLGALGKIKKGADQAADAKKKYDDLTFSEAEERQIGEQVSAKLRERFGVYQNADVAKYVATVGTVIAQASKKPALDWRFIVLDSDGVNAYATPGGFIHITRGLLGMLKDEAELAGVLGHEITHVTERHTVDDLRTSSGIATTSEVAGKGGGLSREIIAQLAGKAFQDIFDGKFSQAKESDSDHVGIQLSNKVGYSPNGLATALQKIADRNKGQEAPNGWFSSHPALKDRISKVGKWIKDEKLTSSALVAARYKQHVSFEVKALSEVPTVDAGASGLASGDKKKADEPKKDEPEKKKGIGLPFGGKQQASSQQTASAGARGLGNDRNARGGGNPAVVAVKITPAEITEFKKGIA